MRESDIEDYLTRRVRAMGGRAYKFVSPGRRGVPDRMVLLPGGRIGFVELKATGRKPSALQLAEIDALRRMGFWAAWIDNLAGVDKILEELADGRPGPAP